MVRALALAHWVLSTIIVLESAAGGQTQADYTQWLDQILRTNPVEKKIPAGSSSVVYRQWRVPSSDRGRGGLRLTLVYVPARSVHIELLQTEKLDPETVLSGAFAGDDLVVVNGGFWKNLADGTCSADGLLIANGIVRNSVAPWKDQHGNSVGGILTIQAGKVRIVPLNSYQKNVSWQTAVQSKPLLVEHGASGIRSDDSVLFNRTAIGVDSAADLIVAGAFRGNGEALSLYEFAHFLIHAPLPNGYAITDAINFDGALNAQLIVPSLRVWYGARRPKCVPDLIRIMR